MWIWFWFSVDAEFKRTKNSITGRAVYCLTEFGALILGISRIIYDFWPAIEIDFIMLIYLRSPRIKRCKDKRKGTINERLLNKCSWIMARKENRKNRINYVPNNVENANAMNRFFFLSFFVRTVQYNNPLIPPFFSPLPPFQPEFIEWIKIKRIKLFFIKMFAYYESRITNSKQLRKKNRRKARTFILTSVVYVLPLISSAKKNDWNKKKKPKTNNKWKKWKKKKMWNFYLISVKDRHLRKIFI